MVKQLKKTRVCMMSCSSSALRRFLTLKKGWGGFGGLVVKSGMFGSFVGGMRVVVVVVASGSTGVVDAVSPGVPGAVGGVG